MGTARESNNTTGDLPVTDILHRIDCLSDANIIREEEIDFCYQVVIRAIEACIAKDYLQFDGHTATNCCHGLALYSRNLIIEASQLDLDYHLSIGLSCFTKFTQNHLPTSVNLPAIWRVPAILVELSIVYVLAFASQKDNNVTRRVAANRIKHLASFGTVACKRISRRLQRFVSNRVAQSYHQFAQEFPASKTAHGIPLSTWSKYITNPYLRTDCEGRQYASHVFAMRIVTAQLAQQKVKVVLVNDLLDLSGQRQARHIETLVGDGNALIPVRPQDEIFSGNPLEPIIVFSGCSYSGITSQQDLAFQMSQWRDSFDGLILACDVHCNQFPCVKSDPNFDSTPLTPDEECLTDLFVKYSSLTGMSVKDPSVFCLSHIYPASLAQVQEALTNPFSQSLPSWAVGQRHKVAAVQQRNYAYDTSKHCA